MSEQKKVDIKVEITRKDLRDAAKEVIGRYHVPAQLRLNWVNDMWKSLQDRQDECQRGV